MERLLTVKDAMQILPLGKTKVTEIINSIPHINTGGKLFCTRRELEMWIARNTVTGKQKPETLAPPPKKPRVKMDGLTEDGLIPYRKSKKGA